MANHTGDAIDAVLAHFADLQISDEWRFNEQTFKERVEGYVLNTIESLKEELECTEYSDQLDGSESVTPANGRHHAETQSTDARRDSARFELNDHLAKGHDPHTACCMVIYELLHVDADVVAGDYVGSFIDWAFEGDAVERDRWRAMVGTDLNDVQKTHDFRMEGF